ncbi:MAG: hypothetical protein KAI24_10880 [Planctomycetes bacterium]|nr:hypothetical protein [Planctomycetota bacterium]
MRAWTTLALSSCMLLGGCLEIEQTITLTADGSGTQAVHMRLRDSLLEELQLRQPAAHLGDAGDPTAVFFEQKVRRELTEAGLELTAHQVEQKGGLRTVDLTASFANFETLRKSPLCGTSAEWELVEGPKPGLAKLTLYPQGKIAWQQARQRAAKMQDELDPIASQFFRKRQAQLQGLDVAIRFKVPGKVLVWTKNMQKVSDHEVLARVTAAQIKTPKDLVRRLAPRYEVIFDARGTELFE